jgi:hypothetical protein
MPVDAQRVQRMKRDVAQDPTNKDPSRHASRDGRLSATKYAKRAARKSHTDLGETVR